ncbi:MAG: hypothetical protein U0625_09670 [Phycisphaerales bacterium]
MGEQVKVADIETIERVRASLLVAAEAFGLALEEAEGEVERTLMWVEGEQRDHWARQIRRSQDAVVAAKSALFRKQEIKATPEARPSVVDEKRALDRARARLELCERKSQATRRWAVELPRQMVVFKGALAPMHTILDRDVPRVNAMLRRMTEHLEEYLRGSQDETRQLLEILGMASIKRGGEEEAAEGAPPDAASPADAAPPPSDAAAPPEAAP